MVEGLRGHVYEKPVPAMRAYLNDIAKGEAGAADFPICIAALGPLMLKLAAQMTRGAVPYNTIPKHTAEAAKILGPDKWLAIEQKVTIETDPVKARALGREELSRYMVLDNYRNAWLGMGFTEADLSNGGSDAFIDADGALGECGSGEGAAAGAFRRRRDACGDPAGACRGGHRRPGCDAGGAGGYVGGRCPFREDATGACSVARGQA